MQKFKNSNETLLVDKTSSKCQKRPILGQKCYQILSGQKPMKNAKIAKIKNWNGTILVIFKHREEDQNSSTKLLT